jgi:hypothetical protein
VKQAVIVGGSATSGTSGVRAFSVVAQLEDNVLSSSMTALGVGDYAWAEARGISISSFNIAGSVQDEYGNSRACYWDSNGDLQPLDYAYGPAVGAYAVNNDGHIVGTEWQYYSPGNYQATHWDPNGDYYPYPMGTISGYSSTLGSYAFAVNENNLVVGTSEQEGTSAWTAFRTGYWLVVNTDQLEPLPNKSNSEALGINESGTAVGDSDGYATLWAAGSTPTPQQLDSSTSGLCQANAINNNGIVVGNRAGTGGSTVAVVWLDTSSASTDLLSLDPAIVGGGTWTLINATAINDENWIVGWGLRNGNKHAFVLVYSPTDD